MTASKPLATLQRQRACKCSQVQRAASFYEMPYTLTYSSPQPMSTARKNTLCVCRRNPASRPLLIGLQTSSEDAVGVGCRRYHASPIIIVQPPAPIEESSTCRCIRHVLA